MAAPSSAERASGTPSSIKLAAGLPVWVLPLVVGLLALYVPTYIMLAKTVWASDEQGHGPIILVVSLWLMWRKRLEYLDLPDKPAALAGAVSMAFGIILYMLGRTQQLDTFEVASKIFVIGAVFLFMKGWSAVRLMAFPLFFLIFMVPLPSILVQVITVPLKMAVSWCAEAILYWFGYPVARTGVVISVGQYQLLVADACAGLNSMFTLEALGLLYMNLMNYKSIARNVILAILIIPISFVANIIRVMILVLVTYHFGDAAGQGFVHGFAGMVLFMVALVLILLTDSILSLFMGRRGAERLPASGATAGQSSKT
jgi:exosortase B